MIIRRGPVAGFRRPLVRAAVRMRRAGVPLRAVRYGVRRPVLLGRPLLARRPVPFGRPLLARRPVLARRYIGGRYVGPRYLGRAYHRPRYVGGRWVGAPSHGRRLIGGRWVGAPWVRPPVAPWVGPPVAPAYAVAAPPERARPWIFRLPPPPWLLRALAPYAVGYAPPAVVDPGPVGLAAAPPPEDAAPPDAPPPAEPEPAPDAGPDDAAPPEGEPPPADGAAPSGELPASIAVDGGRVPIRWDSAPRELGEVAPRGGGVYVVLRNGVPEAAHVAANFAEDVARRYGANGEVEGEAEESGEGESIGWGWRRRRAARRRRRIRYGRVGGRLRGRRRYRLLRSLRRRLGIWHGAGTQPPDDASEPSGSEDEPPPDE